MQLKQRLTARIKYDTARQIWAVHVGITIPHFGTLFSCEQWCRDRDIPVMNQEEINSVKYSNMPIQEMF